MTPQQIKDRLVYGFGISDIPVSINGVHLPEYKIWKAMLRRCYSKNRSTYSKNYLLCTVSDDFKYFSNFKKWCQTQIGFGEDGFHLDKDLLVKGNKIYSKDTCVFLPSEINIMIINQNNKRGDCPIGVCFNKKLGKYQSTVTTRGKAVHLGLFESPVSAFKAYKKEKELILIDFAMLYKDRISEKAFKALINYNVDIND